MCSVLTTILEITINCFLNTVPPKTLLMMGAGQGGGRAGEEKSISSPTLVKC